MLAAREDAASFVASDGQIRSARLEAALAHLRQSNERARVASDMQLAQAILAGKFLPGDRIRAKASAGNGLEFVKS